MKQPTLDYILELHNHIVFKTERIAQLNRMISIIRSKYKDMTDSQLEEAIRDVKGMEREIKEHKKYCEDAQKEVDAFFANPNVA